MCRQRIDPDEWARCGGHVLGDWEEWSGRACGMAALRMILLAYLGEAPPLTELILAGVRADALSDRGWVHAGIARLAASSGIPAEAEAVTADELPMRLKEAPVIVSVTGKFPDDGRKGGHLVVARGTEESGEDGPDILIRDPSAWGQEHDRVPLTRLAASYTGRCITFAPLANRATGTHYPESAESRVHNPAKDGD
jgi:Peptidase C39 family